MNLMKRDTYFDFLRGIAIMLVVANHTKVFLHSASPLGIVNAAMTCIVSPAVPIFLAISGYFMSRKVIDNRCDYFKFLRKQLSIVYLPCLFWSIFHFILFVRDGNSPIKGGVLFFTCGMSFAYYFIAGIMQCYVLLPFVQRIRSYGIFALLLVAITWIGCYTYLFLVRGGNPSTIKFAAPFPNLLIWFALGCYLGQKDRTNYHAWPIAVAAIVALIFSYCESSYIYTLCEKENQDWKITAYIFDFFVILLVFSQPIHSLYRENRLTLFISRLGLASFAVYLTHLLVLIPLSYIPFINTNWLSKCFFLLFTTWAFVELLKKIIPLKYWKYLGLR